MNPHKYFVSADLISNPLCGIDTYKDILNLATGETTRKIKKLFLTGQEYWNYSESSTNARAYMSNFVQITANTRSLSTHYSFNSSSYPPIGSFNLNSSGSLIFGISVGGLSDFKAFLQQQYTNGTPVTVWCVLETPTTETISIPTGLSGTVEGYLIQDGTPTPEAPIYPTANTAKGWYDINAYKRSVLVWNTDTAYERSDGSWT